MGFLFNKILEHAISAADKENLANDFIEYSYNKWGIKVTEKIVDMLTDESARARKKLEEIKKVNNAKKSTSKKERIRNPIGSL